MQNDFIKYLYSIGYKTYDGRNKEIPFPKQFSIYDATVYLAKDLDFDNKIYWGIANGLIVETAPTLRYPLPFNNTNPYLSEERAIKVINNYSPEIVYKAMFDSSKKINI